MLNIVVVDDSTEDLILAERVLRVDCKIKNPIKLCRDGNEAIEHLGKLENDATPALIFVDLVMSPVCGLEVISFWNNMPYAKDSIMVMVSALTDFKVISEGYQRGAKTFVLKPFAKEDMLQLPSTLKEVAVRKTDDGYLFEWDGHSSARLNEDRPISSAMTITA